MARKIRVIDNTPMKLNNVYVSSQISGEYVKKQSDYKELGFDTLQSDLESTGKIIKSTFDGWHDRDAMKKNKSSIQSTYDKLLSFQNYRKKYGITNGDKEIGEIVDAYKETLDGWDKLSEDYGQYKDADAYNRALEKYKLYLEEEKKAETDDLNAVAEEIEKMKSQYKTIDIQARKEIQGEIPSSQLQNYGKYNNPFNLKRKFEEFFTNGIDAVPYAEKPSPFLEKKITMKNWIVPPNEKQLQKFYLIDNEQNSADSTNQELTTSDVEKRIKINEQYEDILNDESLNYFTGLTLEEAQRKIDEKEAYLRRAKYIQNGIKLTNDALNSEYFDDWAQEGASLNPLDFGGHTVGGKSGKSSSVRTIDDYRSAALALFERQGIKFDDDE